LYDERAAQSYRVVHECLAQALGEVGQPAAVKTECEACEDGPGICFQRAELYDVVNTATGLKIAGAAQKRNKHGLLFQGSIEKAALGPLEWDEFSARFTSALAQALRVEAQETPWPDLQEDEVSGLIEQYSSPEWVEYR
jgi:lipoate-protein ligase A